MFNDKDDVPVTAALLSLVGALHGAKQMFLNETTLAEHIGTELPDDYWKRCRALFYGVYAENVKAIGLHANEITFETLMRMKVPPEVMATDFAELPKTFAFNPWLGGINVVK